MMRKKSFFKKLVVVIAFFILISVLSCARKKSENQNQSESLNNQILQALGYIENGEFNYAEKLLQEVKAKDPENCEASYGLALIYLRNLVEIVNSVLSIAFGLGEAFSQSPSLEIQYDNPDFDKSILYNNEIKRLTKKANLSDAIRSILEPAFTETEKIVRNIQIAVSKRCYIRVALPIRLGTEKNTIAHFFVGEKGGNLNKWGPTEAAFIGFFANTVDAIFKFIFVINWDINLEKLAELQFKLNSENLLGFLQQQNPQVQTSIGGLFSQIRPEDLINSAISTDPFDTVALFASLAYIIDTSPELLKLQEGSEKILDEVPQHLTVAFDLFVKIFEFITKYSDKDSIIAYQDSTGDGLSTDDFIDLNVFDYPSLQKGLFINAGRSKIKIDKILISTLFRPFLFKETREKYLSAFTRFRDAFDIKNEKIPESQRWINLQYVLSLIPFISVQDTIRFNPKKFFEGLKSNPEGLRAILPVWTDITGDGVPEFIIEAEAIGTSEKFCFAPPDRIKSRFIVKPLLELRGEEISQLRYITIIYSKGEITQDFWCSISPYLTPVAGREYQASISAEMYINNIELNIETKELNFSVLPCDLFAENEANFVCYRKEKNKEKMIVRIKDDEGKVNDHELQKVLADNKMYKDFEEKVIGEFIKPSTYMGHNIIPSLRIKKEGVSTSAGGAHTCAVKQDGSLWCWGRNVEGQIGDGDYQNKSLPTEIMSWGVSSVSLGYAHTCAIKKDGSLWCWGKNDRGQLGDGTNTSKNTPVQIMSSGVLAVSLGYAHTCAVKQDGSLWCWGDNTYGQIGDGTYISRNFPVQIIPSGVSAVSLGLLHTCAVKRDGSLWCWGDNTYGQIGDGTYISRNSPVQIIPSGVSAVSSGYVHTCAVKQDGSLWCWGNNGNGQLGDGTQGGSSNNPIQIMAGGVSKVSSGLFHNCMIIGQDNSLRCWGNNDYGQLGDGTYESKNFPVQITSDILSVSLGYAHTCAVKQDNSLWCWGWNYYGQLGNETYSNSNTPVRVMSWGVSSVSLGFAHTCAVKQDGSLWCWGDNSYGQIGIGTYGGSISVPVQVMSEGVVSVSLGDAHTCAVKQDGSLWCWGWNLFGQLGNGTDSSSSIPVQIISSGVLGVFLGFLHTCAIKTDGSLWCWGWNYYGQLGDGTNISKNIPVQIMSSGVSSVALGIFHTCAIKTDGSLWCWGDNSYGQIGIGIYGVSIATPVKVISEGVKSVSLGYRHTCVVKQDNSLWCWGNNNYGQLGVVDTTKNYSVKIMGPWDIYFIWNDIELEKNDVSSYTIDVLLPETGKTPFTIKVDENSPGVKKCVGEICSEADEDCSGSTCLYKIRDVEKLLEGYRKICVRVSGWGIENFNEKIVVKSYFKCFEFPGGIVNDNPNTFDMFDREFTIKQETKTTLTFEVKTFARPKNFSLKNPIYIRREGGIEGRTCLFNPRIVLAVAPFKFTTAEGDKGYIEPYIEPRIFLRAKDFDDDFQDKVVQTLAIGDLDNFSVENVRYVRKARKYKVFSAFFSQNENVVPRYFSITEFPLRSLLVLGCASVIPRCFFNSDSAHFPEEVIFRGVSKNLRINKDCEFPEVPWSYYYVAFRDPTFFGSIQVNLDPLKKCDGDPEGWIEPDNYSLNKVTVDLIRRTISPIVSFISSGIGIITGQQQYISTGDFCK